MPDEPDVASGYDALIDVDSAAETDDNPDTDATPDTDTTADAPGTEAGVEPSETGSANTDTGESSVGANPWGTSVYQRTFAWPATVELLPEPPGDRVVLAGCGRGDHAGHFLDRTATVVGFDVASAAVARAHDRYTESADTDSTETNSADTDAVDATNADSPDATAADARFVRGSITDPPVADCADTVVAHLVVSHVADARAAFAGLRRVARGDATLVVTTVHPRYLAEKLAVDRYADHQRFLNDWDGTPIPTYYRPVSRLLSAVAET
ncbi:MAG: class I SAM-dependent methyltransferase, partial [Halobaculum sp.]